MLAPVKYARLPEFGFSDADCPTSALTFSIGRRDGDKVAPAGSIFPVETLLTSLLLRTETEQTQSLPEISLMPILRLTWGLMLPRAWSHNEGEALRGLSWQDFEE